MAANTKSNQLPPMPKLRPRPGLKPPSRLVSQEHDLTTLPHPRSQGAQDDLANMSEPIVSVSREQPTVEKVTSMTYSVPQFNIVVPSTSSSDLPEMTITVSACQPCPDIPEKTSRLLTKNEVKGGRGGRKRNGDGSLIHSIPKFSQV